MLNELVSVLAEQPPTPALPHKGGGSRVRAFPLCGGGSRLSALLPCEGGSRSRFLRPHGQRSQSSARPRCEGRNRSSSLPPREGKSRLSALHPDGGRSQLSALRRFYSLPPCGGGLGWGDGRVGSSEAHSVGFIEIGIRRHQRTRSTVGALGPRRAGRLCLAQ